MSLSVTTVCRHNQARSVLAAAAITRYFPRIRVASAGIQAIEGQRIPQSILELANSWGLEVPDVYSHSLETVQEQLFSSDYVVVAEDDFISSIVALGVSPEKVLSMQDARFDHELVPFDPIGQGEKILSIEIAKAIMTTMQLLRGRDGFQNKYDINAVFTDDEIDFDQKLGIGWENVNKSNGFYVLADFRAPSFRAAEKVCGKVIELKVDRVKQNIGLFDGVEKLSWEQVITSETPLAISGRFEMNQVEKFVLSEPFTGLISSLASKRPVLILTEPQGLGACAFLAAASANNKAILG